MAINNAVVFQANAVDEAGDVLPYAIVQVTKVSDDSLATIYSDIDGTPLANPFNAGADGEFIFYSENVDVNLTVTKGGFSREWKNIFLNSPSLSSSNTGTSTVRVVTEAGSESRAARRRTEEQNWTGKQNFDEITASNAEIEVAEVGSETGTKNGSGALTVHGQSALNGPILLKDVTQSEAPSTLINIGGKLYWAGSAFGTAAFLDAGTDDGDVTLQTKGTWTPYLFNSYGTTITVGTPVSSGTWKIIGDMIFVDFFINFDDALSAPAVGDRIVIRGLPAGTEPASEDGVFSAGSANLYGSIGGGNNAVFDASVSENFTSDGVYLTCMQALGTVDYSMTLGGRFSYKLR